MPELHHLFTDQDRALRDKPSAFTCIIATDASAEEEDVYVTFPGSDDPRQRELVHYWRCGIAGDGSPRFPARGERGFVVELDTGELWLIF